MWELIKENIGEILGIGIVSAITIFFKKIKIFFSRIKIKYEEKKSKKELSAKAKEFNIILIKLIELRAILDAERVKVFSFHNGVEHYTDDKDVKVSCKYESTKLSVSRIRKKEQNMKVIEFPNKYNRIVENDGPVKIVTKNMKASLEKSLLIDAGVDEVIYAKFGEDSKIEGFLEIQFLEEKDHNIESKYELIQAVADHIGYVMRKQEENIEDGDDK